MNSQINTAIDFTLAYYSSDRKNGRVLTVKNESGKITIDKLSITGASEKAKDEKSIFLGLTESHHAVVLDPVDKNLELLEKFPEDAFAAHCYYDPNSDNAWFMNDGDKESGNDRLNCGEEGSSVTVVENPNSSNAKFIKTICVGRGHHQAHFTYPSDAHPDVPHYALISNLKDGTISIIDNDKKSDKFLSVVKTINLFEADKEESTTTIPNNSFPHGLVYSPHSGKIYNLNNGYGNVVVIDPVRLEIESRFDFKGHSNLFIPNHGRYVFGRGADRKTNAQHVIAKLSLLDVETNKIVESINIDDIYISKYFFNPEFTRLYLTTSSSGNDEQKANLKTDALLIYDISNLPELKLVNETRMGAPAGTLDFKTVNDETKLVFSSNAEEGKITLLDKDGNILDAIQVDEPNSHSRLWCI